MQRVVKTIIIVIAVTKSASLVVLVHSSVQEKVITNSVWRLGNIHTITAW
jgi:hypothetical protein